MKNIKEDNSCNVLWGKKKEEYGNFYWLPLLQHLEDARGVIGLLWEHWLCDNQRRFIQNELNLNYEESKNFLMFLAFVHDIGKATPAFQFKKWSADNSPDLNKKLYGKLRRKGFFVEIPELFHEEKTNHALAGQFLLEKFGVSRNIAAIIGAHHGKPVSWPEVEGLIDYQEQETFKENYYISHDENSEIYKKWDRAQKNIFQKALDSCNINKNKLPNVSMKMQVLLSGLVIIADWISSNTDFFPLIPIDDSECKHKSKRLENGWDKWELTDCWIPRSLSSADKYYKSRYAISKPYDIQKKVYEIVENTLSPGIFILEAPMGGGKTEIALTFAEQIASTLGLGGIFFGLPTQATSNGMFPRVAKWLEKIANDSDNIHSIKLVHGKAELNDKFTSYKINVSEDVYKKHNVIINQWFSGRKKSVLDDFVIGTVDQFLLMSLKQKHFALKHLGFTKKAVIIDEVHAYDAFMSEYLLRSIHWLGSYKVPVILLSATLPSSKRNEIILEYIRGYVPEGTKIKPFKEELKKFDDVAYPVLTYTDGLKIKQETNFITSKQKEIFINKLEESELNNKLEELSNENVVVGVVVNTIKKAQEIAKFCESIYKEDEVVLIHSSFIATERIRIEGKILSMIGKNGKRPKKKIIIGTQVLEQSLDIDFDVLITELAPMDLLIQRIGRLHRHEKNDTKRNSKFKKPSVFIVNKSFSKNNFLFGEGTEHIYEKYLLAKTLCLLPSKMLLPKDIPNLVEKTYNEDNENIPSNINKEQFREFENIYKTVLKNKKDNAKNPFLLEKPKTENTIIGIFDKVSEIKTDEGLEAKVRDIKENIEVIALKKIGDGYGFFNSEEDIKDPVSNPWIAKKIACNTIRISNILTTPHNYMKTLLELEEYNFKHLSEWQEQNWLKGMLGIIFDENNEFILNEVKLIYSPKYGLKYDKEKD